MEIVVLPNDLSLKTMSHETRIHITNTFGLAKILLKTKLTDEQKGLIDDIIESAQRLLIHANNLKKIKKLEAHNNKYYIKPQLKAAI